MTLDPPIDTVPGIGNAAEVQRADRRSPRPTRAIRRAPTPERGSGRRPCVWIEAWHEPAVIVTASLRLLDSNEAFRTERRYAKALGVSGSTLRPAAALARRLGSAAADAVGCNVERVVGWPVAEGWFELRVRPVPPPAEWAVVTLHDAIGRRGVRPERLRELYELTPMQAEVTSLLVQTLDANAVAAMLGLSANTVRTHLKAALRKAGVATQVELVQRLALGAARACGD